MRTSIDTQLDAAVRFEKAHPSSNSQWSLISNTIFSSPTSIYTFIKNFVDEVANEVLLNISDKTTVAEIMNILKFVVLKIAILFFYYFFIINILWFIILRAINNKIVYVLYLIYAVIVIFALLFLTYFKYRTVSQFEVSWVYMHNFAFYDLLFIYGFPLVISTVLVYKQM